MYGRPGPTYLDFPGDLLSSSCPGDQIHFTAPAPSPPSTVAPEAEINRAIELLQSAERPLVIIGKGAAYAHAEENIRKFIATTKLPFLPSGDIE
jgi:2-hydroxyacyl-CoA lyase 1